MERFKKYEDLIWIGTLYLIVGTLMYIAYTGKYERANGKKAYYIDIDKVRDIHRNKTKGKAND